jgi:glutamate--cysteine ligase
VLAAIAARPDHSFIGFGLAQTLAHRAVLGQHPQDPLWAARWQAMAAASLEEQRRIEAADTLPFETYRARYIGQPLMSGEQFQLPA